MLGNNKSVFQQCHSMSQHVNSVIQRVNMSAVSFNESICQQCHSMSQHVNSVIQRVNMSAVSFNESVCQQCHSMSQYQQCHSMSQCQQCHSTSQYVSSVIQRVNMSAVSFNVSSFSQYPAPLTQPRHLISHDIYSVSYVIQSPAHSISNQFDHSTHSARRPANSGCQVSVQTVTHGMWFASALFWRTKLKPARL
jgi:hypothetical protein